MTAITSRIYVECCDRMPAIENTYRIHIDGEGWVNICRDGFGCTA